MGSRSGGSGLHLGGCAHAAEYVGGTPTQRARLMLPDGQAAVHALSHDEVDHIRQRFRALNPYDPSKVPDLLKHELNGLCLAISAKRYAIRNIDDPALMPVTPPVKISQHGLGRYLDPISPREERRNAAGPLQ